MRPNRSMLVVGLLAIAVYAITLGGTFVYDDVAVILKDGRVADPHRWGEYWSDGYNLGIDNLYRPVTSMSYAIAFWLHGETAWWYHACNTLLHAIASVLVAWFASKLARRSATPHAGAIGLIAGALFAAHPVHVEAVANIVGRAELLCAIGTLGAIGLALDPLTKGRVAAIGGLFVLALLSKEQGMLVPLMVGVVAWVKSAPGRPESNNRHPERSEGAGPLERQVTPARTIGVERRPSFGGAGSFAALRMTMLGARSSPRAAALFVLLTVPLAAYVYLKENVLHLKFWWDRVFLDRWIQPMADSVGWDRALVPVTIAGRYLGLLVAPTTLRIDYGGQIVPGVFRADDPYFWLGIVAISLWVGLFAIACVCRDRLLIASLALFAIAYAVVSNTLTIIGVNVAERLMYLPSAFFLIVVARGMTMLPRRVVIVFTSGIVAAFGMRTVTYARHWNDRLAFYEYAARVEPRSMKALLLLSGEHLDRGELAQAEAVGRQATNLLPAYQDAWLRLANILIERGDFDAAQEALDRALKINVTERVGKLQNTLNERRAAATRPATSP